jgi:hypothetical protein
MNPSDLISLVSVVGGFVVAIACTAIYYAFHAWKQWQATMLVRDMIARGYTAQEIIQMFQVLGHRRPQELNPASDVPPAKPVKQPAFGP